MLTRVINCRDEALKLVRWVTQTERDLTGSTIRIDGAVPTVLTVTMPEEFWREFESAPTTAERTSG